MPEHRTVLLVGATKTHAEYEAARLGRLAVESGKDYTYEVEDDGRELVGLGTCRLIRYEQVLEDA